MVHSHAQSFDRVLRRFSPWSLPKLPDALPTVTYPSTISNRKCRVGRERFRSVRQGNAKQVIRVSRFCSNTAGGRKVLAPTGLPLCPHHTSFSVRIGTPVSTRTHKGRLALAETAILPHTFGLK